LLQHTSHPDKVVIVNKVCDDVGLAFKLWDGAFSAIHSPNPTVEHCTVTQTRIDNAMAHIRGMGFSVSYTKNAWDEKSCGETDENYTGGYWNAHGALD
jgi:hypothetical protein